MSKRKESEQAPKPGGGLPPRELQQLWFTLSKQTWTNLAIVPADWGFSARRLAEDLVRVGELHKGGGIKLLDGQALVLNRSAALILQMSDQSEPVQRIVLLDALVSNQAGIPVAMAADKVLLVVKLGGTGLPSARQTVELVGEDRIIGCVALDEGY